MPSDKPAPTKLLLGERSNKAPGEGSAEQILPSSTSRKLDELCPGWQDAFVVRNIWKDKEDDADAEDRIRQILEETDPDIVVTLGITASLAFGVKYHTDWLSWSEVHGLQVLKFPHTSGRNRSWNDKAFVEAAAKTLSELARTEDTADIVESASVPENVSESAPATSEAPKPVQVLTRSKSPQVPKDFEHSIKHRFYKVEKLHTAECSCGGWSASAPQKSGVESNAMKHLEDKKRK